MEVLIQYKEIIAIVIAFIFEVIILLVFKKRPEVVDNSLLAKLSDWILEAEDKFKAGRDKLDYVCQKAQLYLGDKYIENDVVKIIEYLLTLPEKKGKK